MIPIAEPDENMPVNTFRFEHDDGRIDLFMLLEGELIPINLTKIGDPPNWVCPICSFVNKQSDNHCMGCTPRSKENDSR